jgi:excinuclease UvrABC nuclease subunit
MPFAPFAARSFTAVSIQKNAPESSGVYGLFNHRECLFVGQSSNIRSQLLTELREAAEELRAENPTGFTVELCSSGDRALRLQRLVRELGPRFRSPSPREV